MILKLIILNMNINPYDEEAVIKEDRPCVMGDPPKLAPEKTPIVFKQRGLERVRKHCGNG